MEYYLMCDYNEFDGKYHVYFQVSAYNRLNNGYCFVDQDKIIKLNKDEGLVKVSLKGNIKYGTIVEIINNDGMSLLFSVPRDNIQVLDKGASR